MNHREIIKILNLRPKQSLWASWEFGPYVIAQTDNFDRSGQWFQIIIEGKPLNRVYDTLDQALIGLLALKYDGINTQADRLICQMLGIENG